MSAKLHLFEAYGIELEYMIVHRDDLTVAPICDQLFQDVSGKAGCGEYVAGRGIAWSNELVNHVVEFKTDGPARTLAGLAASFHESVSEANRGLAAHNARLLGTGAHPFLRPHESELWPHENSEIYRLYDRIFDSRGHGWRNLQSMHINLPFANDEEFGRLHAAVRIVLPLLPALCASTPILEDHLTGELDTRLAVYEKNQQRIPEIAGQVIPEAVFDEAAYESRIFAPMMAAVKPHDPDGIFEPYWLNSRGAIARFDRGAIEIRIMDLQECPAADLACAEIVVALLRRLVDERLVSYAEQCAVDTGDLYRIYRRCVRRADRAVLREIELYGNYLNLFGINISDLTGPGGAVPTMNDVWRRLFTDVADDLSDDTRNILRAVLHRGSLAEYIRERFLLGRDHLALLTVYQGLADCLSRNGLAL